LRRRDTNRQAFREIFWEHALLPGSLDAFRFWRAAPGGASSFDQEALATLAVAAL